MVFLSFPEKPVKMASGSVLVQSDQGALLADQLGADAYLEVSSTTGRGIAKLLEEVIAKPIVKGRSSPMSLVKIPQSMSYMFSNHSAYTPSTSNAPNAPQSRVRLLSMMIHNYNDYHNIH